MEDRPNERDIGWYICQMAPGSVGTMLSCRPWLTKQKKHCILLKRGRREDKHDDDDNCVAPPACCICNAMVCCIWQHGKPAPFSRKSQYDYESTLCSLRFIHTGLFNGTVSTLIYIIRFSVMYRILSTFIFFIPIFSVHFECCSCCCCCCRCRCIVGYAFLLSMPCWPVSLCIWIWNEIVSLCTIANHLDTPNNIVFFSPIGRVTLLK